MTSNVPLTGSHLRTYNTIFQHPVSHNLAWHDVHALFRQLGQVETEANGNLKVTRNGHVIILHPARSKDVDQTDEVLGLRRFLEQSETVAPGSNGMEAHWLLLIDHHEARIFRTEMDGALPRQILPHAPADHFRHAPNSLGFSRGKEKPDPNSFFEPVTKVLQAGGPILIFGSGTGKSSEMDQFTQWVKLHHPDLAARIIGSVVVDEHHLTEGQLLEKAREFYAMPAAARP